jgi:predicted sugar kinase
MGEITLKDGREIKIDVADMTVDEWRKFAGPGGTTKEEDNFIAKYTDLKLEEIGKLRHRDFVKLIAAIVKASREPDPT